MLKTQTIELTSGARAAIRELPALEADRAARSILTGAGLEPDGGVVSLALQHLETVRRHYGEGAPALLEVFVRYECAAPRLHWREVERVQNAALALHTGFVIGRETLEIPVKMQAAMLTHGGAEHRVSFCSPFIAAVINSQLASYVELETVLSTEDAFNLSELVTVNALRDFEQAQREATT